MPNSAPRLFVSLIGDVSREPFARVKYGFFLKELQKSFPLVVCDATLRGYPRLLNAITVFSPNRTLWKERFYKNVPAFQLRSKKVAGLLQQQGRNVDAVLQIGVLFDSLWAEPDIPGIIYTDYTSHLSSRKPESGRSPYRAGEFQEWMALEKGSFTRSTHICSRGEFVRKSIIEDYGIPSNRVTAVGGGVNFESLPVLKPKPESTCPTALFIGKDFYRKGGDILLKAFKLVRQSIPDARLIMVTENIPAGEFDLSGVQVIAPTWDRALIQSLYEQADCFVLPSRLETWGDVLLEAMSYGLPCIGVADDAMSEIIVDGKTGLIIPPGDSIALSTAIKQILNNREYGETLSIAARRRIENTFTWEQVVKRLTPIIEASIHSSTTIIRKSD